jgi:hypothetical protein
MPEQRGPTMQNTEALNTADNNNRFQHVHSQFDLALTAFLYHPVGIERKVRILALQDLDWLAVY